jgi:DNA-directed RNA polymerase specialized sigma24 family protein
MDEVSRILSAIEQGDPQAAEQLLPLVYDELRKLAAAKLARETPGQTLQATALVHEAYLRLVGVEQAQHWNGRGHFFAAAAEAMRRILVENVRRKQALGRLTQEDPGAAEVARLRLFAGLSVEDAAGVVGVSRATAFRHWTYARAWLQARLREGDSETR